MFQGNRPGAWILELAGCTANFVFGSPGNYSIGTAGQCAEVGDEVTIVAAPDLLMTIGKVVKSMGHRNRRHAAGGCGDLSRRR